VISPRQVAPLAILRITTRMSLANNPQDPTADYRKYPKGPNFLLIVVV
jgi:hypothetical protein